MQNRITITIPSDLVEAADARARSLDRSRSWVLVEALRRYLAGSSALGTVREPATQSYGSLAADLGVVPVDASAEVAASRRHRLQAELALPPLERLRRAEELAHLGRSPASLRARAAVQIVAFDSYEDYYEWKKPRLIRA
jgi:hypothetical protein